MGGHLAPGRAGDHVGAEVVAHLRDDRIVAVTPAWDEYRLLITSATARTQVDLARPEGIEPRQQPQRAVDAPTSGASAAASSCPR